LGLLPPTVEKVWITVDLNIESVVRKVLDIRLFEERGREGE
jgi:hypothetical protein